MHLKLLTILLFILLCKSSFTQIFPGESIKVLADNDTLLNPWLGGLDLPQFSGGDIDRDGKEDLVIFDKKGNKIIILLKQENGEYKYAPDLEHLFPVINDFALFKDYNCDGLIDIFCQANAGIRVYKQTIVSGEITFELASSKLEFDYNGSPLNLYNVNGDIPGIEDVDGDGDLDIVAFPFLSNTVALFRNISQESGYGCDSLIYEEFTPCWGYFKENNSNNLIDFDISCKGGNNSAPIPASTPKHIGSSILLFDPNEDNKIDVLLGDVSFHSLVYLENDHTNLDAHMLSTAVDYSYPSFDTTINVETFPAAYTIDVSNDGKKDLLIAPNSTIGHVNTTSSWLFEATGNGMAPFHFVQNNFLIDGTIDLGSFSYPIFFDHNGDNLLDLIVSNGYLFESSGTSYPALYYYENVGTDTLPAFELKNNNYLGLNNFGTNYLRPTFGDLDNDEDLDLIIGDIEGNIHFFENISGSGSEAIFAQAQLLYFNIDVGNYAHPQLFDVNKDNLLDLVIGQGSNMGQIAYYWNFGTPTNPMFSVDSVNNIFGNITTNEPGFVHGYSSPFILATDTKDILYTGSDVGFISKYIINPDSLKSGTFYMESPNLLESKVGIRSNLAIVDINNDDALDYFIGNSRGGVNFYTEKTPTDTTIIDTTNIAIKELNEYLNFSLYPNPSNELIQIELNNPIDNINIDVFNILGQIILHEKKYVRNFKINVKTYKTGIYYLKISDDYGNTFVKSFLKN